MRLTLTGLNLLALGALVVPAVLILKSAGAVSHAPLLFGGAVVLLVLGVLALIAAMLLIGKERNRTGGVIVVLPVALLSLLGGVGLLVGLSL